MKKLKNIFIKIYPYLVFIGLIILWEFVVEADIVSRFVLPSPTDIIRVFVNDWGVFIEHFLVTMLEAIVGLIIGIALGFVFAVLMERYEVIKRIFYPIIVVSQTIPTIAIAPLLVLWLGYDILPKIVLIVVTTFYPIAVGIYEGFSSIDKDYITLMESMGATDLEIFRYLKLPATLPNFFSALKISTSYSVVAAVISEWLGGFRGLGVYMTRVKKAYAFDKMFAVIIIISVLSLLLISLVNVLRKKIIKWEYVDEN